jgi:hypothetical protein
VKLLDVLSRIYEPVSTGLLRLGQGGMPWLVTLQQASDALLAIGCMSIGSVMVWIYAIGRRPREVPSRALIWSLGVLLVVSGLLQFTTALVARPADRQASISSARLPSGSGRRPHC